MSYQTLHVHGGVPVKAWVNGVPFDPKAELQLRQTAQMPFIHKWVAAMPDVHVGIGATIGSVIPTKAAIIPAAVASETNVPSSSSLGRRKTTFMRERELRSTGQE